MRAHLGDPSVFDVIEALATAFRGVDGRRAYNWTSARRQVWLAQSQKPVGTPPNWAHLEGFNGPPAGVRTIEIATSGPLFHQGHRRPRWHLRGEVVRLVDGLVVDAPAPRT